jgi:hypothetical protein
VGRKRDRHPVVLRRRSARLRCRVHPVATAVLPRVHRAGPRRAASDLLRAASDLTQAVQFLAVHRRAALVRPQVVQFQAALPAVPHLDPTARLPLEDLVFSQAARTQAVQFRADSRSPDPSRSLQHRSSAERPERMDLSATCATPS